MQNVDALISLIRANRDREALELLNASPGLAAEHSEQEGQLHGATPLHWAAHRNAVELCERLIQLGADVNDSATAESIRRNLRDPALAPLFDILAEHRAAPKCQFDAFAEYVAAAEEHGVENFPLYRWTKVTIENPAKTEKYLKSFTLYVDDREVYAKEIADALETDLQPLATSGLITRISKYDTNPANNPQPP